MNVITVEQISKHYDKTAAVKDLSFEVPVGTCFGFLGPNGAGKTTLMKMLYGRCRPDNHGSGTMKVFGHDPCTNELAIKNLSGVVPQDDNLDEELNVTQNLLVYARFYGLSLKIARARIRELLEFMELSEKSKDKIKELSGGMKRRLVIARALLNRPQLLILDEPTTGLDPQVRHLIWDSLRQLKSQGTTLLLTTHYMEEAFQICDRLLIMHKGRNIMEGKPAELIDQTIENFVLELVDQQAIAGIHEQALPPAVRREPCQGIVRLYANELEPLRAIADTLDGGHYHLRQSNLEDVFLKATGRVLNDRQ